MLQERFASACVLCARDSLPVDDKECRLVAANAVVPFYAQRRPSVKRENARLQFSVNLKDASRTPQSNIVVSFRRFTV